MIMLAPPKANPIKVPFHKESPYRSTVRTLAGFIGRRTPSTSSVNSDADTEMTVPFVSLPVSSSTNTVCPGFTRCGNPENRRAGGLAAQPTSATSVKVDNSRDSSRRP